MASLVRLARARAYRLQICGADMVQPHLNGYQDDGRGHEVAHRVPAKRSRSLQAPLDVDGNDEERGLRGSVVGHGSRYSLYGC